MTTFLYLTQQSCSFPIIIASNRKVSNRNVITTLHWHWLYISKFYFFFQTGISVRLTLSVCSILKNIKGHSFYRSFIYRENPAELTIISQAITFLKAVVMDGVLPHFVCTQVLKTGGICTYLKWHIFISIFMCTSFLFENMIKLFTCYF